MLAAALAITCATSVLFGLLPAFAAAHDAIASALNEEGRSGTSGVSARRARALLVVAEVALSLVLLVGAGLLLASFRHLVEQSPGFQADQLVTMRVTLPQAKYGDHARIVNFYQSLLRTHRAARRRSPAPASSRSCRSAAATRDRDS